MMAIIQLKQFREIHNNITTQKHLFDPKWTKEDFTYRLYKL